MPDLFQLPQVIPLNLGVTMPGALLNFYLTGTSARQNTYQNSALTTPHANPVVADANGVFAPIFLDPTLPNYRVTLTTSTGSVMTGYPVDGVSSVSSGGSGLLYVRYIEDSSAVADTITLAATAPSLLAYAAGLMIEVVVANTTTSTTVNVNVNALGNRLLKHADGSALIAGEIRSGQTILIAYKATSSTFHILSPTGSLSVGDGTAAIPAIRSYTDQDSGLFIGSDGLFHISKNSTDYGSLIGLRTGSTSVQLTGFASPISTSIDYKSSEVSTVLTFTNRMLDNKNAVSMTTAMTMTGLDTSILGNSDRYAYCYGIYNNSALVSGVAYYAGGTIFFNLGFDGTGLFTAAGNKGLYKFWSVILPM